jgi:hypothetical protein
MMSDDTQIELNDDPRNYRIEEAITRLESIANSRNRNAVEFAIQVLREYQNKTGQAYQVIGSLAYYGGMFDDVEIHRALDYYSHEGYEDDFLSWAPRCAHRRPRFSHKLASFLSWLRRL